MRSSQFGRSPPLGQYWLSVFWLCVFLEKLRQREHQKIPRGHFTEKLNLLLRNIKTLVIFAECCTPKKSWFFWHYEPWICQEGPKNNKKYFQERFLKKRSLDTFNSDGSHQAETTSPSRGAVVFDTSYPTPNSYIMCKFLFDFDLSIYVRRFDRKKSDNLETSRFFWQFWHLWKKFDIFQKYKLVFRNWQLALFKIGNICSRILVDCVDSLKSWNCN